MVYVSSWLDFLRQSRSLYLERPGQTRYTLKYRHADAELVLRVTDDRRTIQFRTHQQDELRHVERINRQLMQLMTSKQPHEHTEEDEEEPSAERRAEQQRPPLPSSSLSSSAQYPAVSSSKKARSARSQGKKGSKKGNA